jgi:hypothetical protein
MFFALRRVFYDDVGLACRAAKMKVLECLPQEPSADNAPRVLREVKLINSGRVQFSTIPVFDVDAVEIEQMMRRVRMASVPIYGHIVTGKAQVSFTFYAHLERPDDDSAWRPCFATVEIENKVLSLQFSADEKTALAYGHHSIPQVATRPV